MKRIFTLVGLLGILLILPTLPAQPASPQKKGNPDSGVMVENLNVFHQWIRWNNPGSLLMNHLIQQADSLYARRDQAIAQLKTRDDWEKRQKLVQKKLRERIGPFPEKTALQAQITGTMQKNGYRVEKIVYQAMPGFHVTGCLFLPDGISGKLPAILNFIGHNQNAFRAGLYQQVILNLVKKGMIVLAIDPPGQGERVQYFNPQLNLSSIGYSVIEHCYFGNQCFLSGTSCAKYFIWDGIRAIDYLLTRKEVDPAKIGVTGFSGGGTITSYVSALDDRVSVSVPCSWATAGRRQLETKGAQDAETELVRGLAEGISFEDLLEVRAPKPTLMTFVSRDQYLSLQGAREAFREAQKAYEAFGQKEGIQLVEDDYEHWMTPKLRCAIYAFFLRHFGIPGSPAEEDVELLSEKELQITPTGQVSTALQSKMIFDMQRDETAKLMERLEKSREKVASHLITVQKKAVEISGYQGPSGYEAEPFINGRYTRDGYAVEKIAIRGEGSYPIPMLLFVPDNPSGTLPAIVYLHSKGKTTDALPGGEIEKLVKKGYVVAAPDLLGIGETKDNSARGLATGYTGVLLGRSIPGIQAGDIVRVAHFLKTRPEVHPQKIGSVAIGEVGISLIHAAALEASIQNVTLLGLPVSFRAVAMNRFYKIGISEHNKGLGHPFEIDFTWGIAGVLTAYDLPDLIGCIAPRKVLLAAIKDQMLEPVSAELVKKEMEFPALAFSSKRASGNFQLVSSYSSLGSLVDWCFK